MTSAGASGNHGDEGRLHGLDSASIRRNHSAGVLIVLSVSALRDSSYLLCITVECHIKNCVGLLLLEIIHRYN